MIGFFSHRKLRFSTSTRKCIFFTGWFRFSLSGFSSQASHLTHKCSGQGEPGRSELSSYAYSGKLRRGVVNGDVKDGMGPHRDAMERGNLSDLFALNNFLNEYVKAGLLSDARKLFDEMPERNTFSFVTLMRGYAQSLKFVEAMECFHRLQSEGHELNPFAFTTLLKLLVSAGLGDLGWSLHACICKLGHDSNAFVGTALMDAYSVCGNADIARKVFDGIVDKDMVSWNGMLSCYVQNNCFKEALQVFTDARRVGYYHPTNFTFAGVLKACLGMEAFGFGQGIHGYVLKTRHEVDHYVGIALLDLYAKFGDMGDARLVFDEMCKDNVIPWSFMIARYSQNGQSEQAVELFCQLRRGFVLPNQFTYASVLQACGAMECLSLGRQIHCHVLKVGFNSDLFVTNALIDVYAKCGLMENSMDLFLESPNRNDVSWNTLIVGYTQTGNGEKALNMFMDMLENGVNPTKVTYSNVLRACASLASLEPGLQIHSLTVKTMHDKDLVVANALVDMYAKCGRFRDARIVFDTMNYRDEVSWNTMISGYSMHGLGAEAIQVFEMMLKAKCKPDKLTFIGILSACSNAGLLHQGKTFFKSMVQDHNIKPCIEHYTCMVLVLGRSGHLDEAMRLIDEIPFEHSERVWRALLGTCVVHENVDLGRISAHRALKMAPEDDATHSLLSNIYATAKSWENVASVRRSMKVKGVKKETGLSWIENQGATYYFAAGDTSHPNSKIIFGMLEWLNVEMKRVPDCNAGFLDVEDIKKGSISGTESKTS